MLKYPRFFDNDLLTFETRSKYALCWSILHPFIKMLECFNNPALKYLNTYYLDSCRNVSKVRNDLQHGSANSKENHARTPIPDIKSKFYLIWFSVHVN